MKENHFWGLTVWTRQPHKYSEEKDTWGKGLWEDFSPEGGLRSELYKEKEVETFAKVVWWWWCGQDLG